jgi:hypothetical protein
MSQGKSALQRGVRQVQDYSRHDDPVAPSSAAAPAEKSSGGNGRMMLFMGLGILAGAIAAVAAVKLLLKI